MDSATGKRSILSLTVLVSALGYFVDIYDLQLFNLVAEKSLNGIGVTDPALLTRYNVLLFNWQMGGMLAGGLIWGVLGDKRGRKSILFGSILLYSLANVANGLVTNIEGYEAARFLAGLGLAGELGAAITLVSETMGREHRGWGTMGVVTVGALGAVVANVIAKSFAWQVAYFTGGGLGLALLALRVGTFESTMFNKLKDTVAARGDFLWLFKRGETAARYFACVAVGLPVWFMIGVLIKFAPVFSGVTGVQGKATAGDAIMWAYVGLSVGDLVSGAMSQWMRSRRKVVGIYLLSSVVLILAYLFWRDLSLPAFYALCFLLGAATGYWALFVSIAAEQFGTNIRATVTTTVPNFVRGAVIPITLSFKALEGPAGSVGASLVVGGVCFALAAVAIGWLKETFGRDLDYLEPGS